MSFFCLFWVPFFLMLRRSLANKEGGSIFALFFGSITAVISFLLGDIVTPGGFGFSRWLYGFIDIVCMPALLPFIIYSIYQVFRGNSNADFEGFVLFWLIPVGALRALSWSAGSDPILLVAVPLLWTALAVGIPYFLHLIIESYHAVLKIIYVLCILAIPVTGAFSYWAFFSQQTILGLIFFAVTQVPLALTFKKQ